MSPYWSEEKLFGRWGPTNRTAFRSGLIAFMLAFGLLAYIVISYTDYSHKLNSYIHDARDTRIATQQLQQQQLELAQAQLKLQQQQLATDKQQIKDNRQAIQQAVRQVRDLACFVVQFAHKSGQDSPFIRKLNRRYDCGHYHVGKHAPGPVGSASGSGGGGGAGGGSTTSPSPSPSPTATKPGNGSPPPKARARHRRAHHRPPPCHSICAQFSNPSSGRTVRSAI